MLTQRKPPATWCRRSGLAFGEADSSGEFMAVDRVTGEEEDESIANLDTGPLREFGASQTSDRISLSTPDGPLGRNTDDSQMQVHTLAYLCRVSYDDWMLANQTCELILSTWRPVL